MSERGPDPLVSAVIPAYGRPKKLKRALRSIESQPYPDIEIIVVETPTPTGAVGERQISEIIDRELVYVRTEPDVMPSEARNIGIEQSSGEYIAFLDDDDEWLPEKTEKQVAQLETSSEETRASIVGNKKINPSGEVINTYEPTLPENPVCYQLCWNIGSFSTLMIHTSVPKVVGGIDEAFNRREDQDFLLRIAQEYEFAVISEPLAHKHSGEYTQLSGDYEAGERANARFREKHGELATKLGMYDEMEFAFEFTQGRTALDNRDYGRARTHFLRSLWMKPLDKGVLMYLLAASGGRVTHRLGRTITNRS